MHARGRTIRHMLRAVHVGSRVQLSLRADIACAVMWHACGTLSVRLWLLTAAPARSSVTLCPGRLMARERNATLVSFCDRGSALPTLCFARLKSMPTPGFLRLVPLPLAMTTLMLLLAKKPLRQPPRRALRCPASRVQVKQCNDATCSVRANAAHFLLAALFGASLTQLWVKCLGETMERNAKRQLLFRHLPDATQNSKEES